MGIRFTCPSGHKLHVKSFLAGKRGVCPKCGAKFLIPASDEIGQSGAAVGVPGGDSPSQSIIVAIANDDPSPAPATKAGPGQTASKEAAGTSEPVALPARPAIHVAAAPAASPTAWYLSRRERRRRKQLTMAVMLLVAMIVLALLLIWVLQRGDTLPTAAGEPGHHRPIRLDWQQDSRLGAIGIERKARH